MCHVCDVTCPSESHAHLQISGMHCFYMSSLNSHILTYFSTEVYTSTLSLSHYEARVTQNGYIYALYHIKYTEYHAVQTSIEELIQGQSSRRSYLGMHNPDSQGMATLPHASNMVPLYRDRPDDSLYYNPSGLYMCPS